MKQPVKFVLRYTFVPFLALVAVVIWVWPRSSAEIDARQYASLSLAWPAFPPELRHDVADAMKSGQLSKWDYSSLVRKSLDDGIALDWPQQNGDVQQERAKLAALISADRP